jgi:hypothetical protein
LPDFKDGIYNIDNHANPQESNQANESDPISTPRIKEPNRQGVRAMHLLDNGIVTTEKGSEDLQPSSDSIIIGSIQKDNVQTNKYKLSDINSNEKYNFSQAVTCQFK